MRIELRRSPLAVAVMAVGLINTGCTAYPDVSVVVSPRFAEINDGVVRVGIATFSFHRLPNEQGGGVSWVRPANAGEVVADAAADLPLKLGYNLVDRRQLVVLLHENDLSEADLLMPGKAAKVGRLLGMQAVIVGTVDECGYWNWPGGWCNDVSFSARMIRLDTGEVMWNIKCANYGPDSNLHELTAICEEAATQLRKQSAYRK